MNDPICEGIRMNKNNQNTFIISKAAAVLLAMILSMSLIVPASCINTYAVTDDTGTAAAEIGQPDAGVSDQDQSEPGSTEAVQTATSISSCRTSYNKRFDRDLIIEADISPAGGREVQLQRYNSSDSTWETVLTMNAGAEEVASSEEETAGNGTSHVSFNVPKEEREKVSSTWRIFVPATETAAEAASENIKVTTRNLEELDLSARTACIYRIDSKGKGTMIYSKYSCDEVAQASTTKLMTAILLLENGRIEPPLLGEAGDWQQEMCTATEIFCMQCFCLLPMMPQLLSQRALAEAKKHLST